MSPYEIYMLTLWGIFALVGLARRFPREFGASIVFVGMVFGFFLVGDKLGDLSFALTSALGIDWSEQLVAWMVYSGLIVLIVAATYVGETFVFAGEWPPSRVAGMVVDATIGLVNGWLVVGTWWYYTHKLNYPQQAFGWYAPPLSATGQSLVKLTPLALVPEEYALWILAGALLALIALKVLR